MGNIKVVKADLIATGKKFAVIVSRFNKFISSKLVDGAIDTFVRHGVKEEDILVMWVPGSFEIPALAQKIAVSKKYDAIVCLGTIIRGETPHFDFVASEAAKGIAQVSMATNVPCVFGIITADTLEQALDRAGIKSGNKGKDAAESAIEMANLYELLSKK
ncbi:6,7-dimethyl-8-ribityllumazine synthase [Candidatus Omnitrophus magneticus]|uniref:6,7-dimethyl-8-ribityllumazine synthase n=1 Tax=Candidatus Omnitrophus magneticus TaxID=1609969 RepID=A0A0F0CP19_9BACT|nr:6,7-dimethyl-8-ribityllumazine synthase [Candidatus Omnitrophus magneticus]